MKKENIFKIIFGIVVIMMFVSIYMIMINTVPMGEDFALRTTDFFTKATIPDILNKMSSQMSMWNMRIGEQIAILFNSIDRSIFNLLNTCLIVFYFYLFNVYITGSIKIKNYMTTTIIMVLAYCFVFAFMPALGESFFWLTGSSNYLWACMIVLLLFLPYRLLLFSDKKISKLSTSLLSIYVIVLGFLSGLSNENTSIPIIIMIILAILYRRFIIKEKVPLWAYLGLLSTVVGTITLLTAPSTKYRIKFYNEVYQVGKITLSTYLNRIENVINSFFYSKSILYVFIFSVILLISWIIKMIIQKKSPLNKEHKNTSIMIGIMIIGILSVGALIMAPYVEKRSFLFFVTLWNMAIISLLINLFKKYQYILGIVSIIFLVGIMPTYKDIKLTYNSFNKEWDRIETKIKNAYYQNESSVTIELPSHINNRIMYFNGIAYIRSNPDYLKHYYNIEVKV